MKKRVFGILFVFIVGAILISEYGFELIHSGEGQVTGSSWLSGWSYRKAHKIKGSTAGDLFNYPIVINVHYDNGADFDGEVYLKGKCRTDFGDIRFTDSTGVDTLDYWIQQNDEGNQALFWVEINYVPQSPRRTTIYIYYGNQNASTTSNKDGTFNLATDFEDATTQGWSISWSTHVTWDGVSSSTYQGAYCRGAGRRYGSSYAGNGYFYERFRNTVYLASGSYRVEGAARFSIQDSYRVPKEIKFLANGVTVDNVSNPGTQWRWLGGNFSLSTSGSIELDVEFHLRIQNLENGGQSFYIDCVFVRRWSDPEPTHDTWGIEETSDDKIPPEIVSVEWTPTSPYPFVPMSTPRQGEPVMIRANVNEPVNESGIDFVRLSYRVDSGEWWNTSMTFNATTGLWTATIPGQPGNAAVEFLIGAQDNAGNHRDSSLYSYDVKSLIVGDIDGDGDVDYDDFIVLAGNYGKETS